MKLKNLFYITGILGLFALQSCSQAKGDYPGTEYMPDMFHSIAYEANYYDYYYYNTWGDKEDYKKMAMPRRPVVGTIPRGYAGTTDVSGNGISIPPNGAVPYYYGDTEDERTRASTELIDNPYPITEMGLAQGGELYNIYCGICHGETGDGNGYIVRDDGGVYPAQPTNLISDDMINSSNGRFYHAIMFGKNVMGSYTDKLSYKERWDVIHYIRSLQAKAKELEYNAQVNTLNSVDKPEASVHIAQIEEEDEVEMQEVKEEKAEGGVHTGNDH